MTSEKQLEANRQNALKSTGPTSTEGKLRASKNAMKHGILSKNLMVSGEKTSEYQSFRKNLIDTLQPEGTMEALLVEKIACLAWRQRRAVQAESSLFHKGLSNEDISFRDSSPFLSISQPTTRYPSFKHLFVRTWPIPLAAPVIRIVFLCMNEIQFFLMF